MRRREEWRNFNSNEYCMDYCSNNNVMIQLPYRATHSIRHIIQILALLHRFANSQARIHTAYERERDREKKLFALHTKICSSACIKIESQLTRFREKVGMKFRKNHSSKLKERRKKNRQRWRRRSKMTTMEFYRVEHFCVHKIMYIGGVKFSTSAHMHTHIE